MTETSGRIPNGVNTAPDNNFFNQGSKGGSPATPTRAMNRAAQDPLATQHSNEDGGYGFNMVEGADTPEAPGSGLSRYGLDIS